MRYREAPLFDAEVIEYAWMRSKGKCECTDQKHRHPDPCNSSLVRANRRALGRGEWDAVARIPFRRGGEDIAPNCIIMCYTCARKVEEELVKTTVAEEEMESKILTLKKDPQAKPKKKKWWGLF